MIPAAEFLEFLRRHNEAALRVAEHLSMELHRAWEQTRVLARVKRKRVFDPRSKPEPVRLIVIARTLSVPRSKS